MNRPEQHFLRSHAHWNSIAVQTEHHGAIVMGGAALTIAGGATEMLQLMALNAAYFEDRFANVSALGWWMNFVLAFVTVVSIAVLIHKLFERLSSTTLSGLFAWAGAAGLLVIATTPWLIDADAGRGGQMGGDADQAATGAVHFVATVLRSPLVVLMALVAALGVVLVKKGVAMRAVHRHALSAMHALESAFPVLDDALQADHSRARRKAGLTRETMGKFAKAFSMHEHMRMDAAIALARGAAMGGQDFIQELEAGLNQGWASFDPDMRALAETISPKDIDLCLIADEIGNLGEDDKARLIDHAAAHKRRFSETRILNALNH